MITMRSLATTFVIVASATASSAAAQTNDSVRVATGGASSIRWTYGSSYGQMAFDGGATERAVGLSLGMSAWNWLSLGINPSYAWAKSAAETIRNPLTGNFVTIPSRSVSGLADLAVSASAWVPITAPWSPSAGISLGASLPTADTSTVGSGTTSLGGSLWFGISPARRLSLSVSTSASLSNGYGVALAGSSLSSLAGSASVELGWASLSASYSADVGSVTDTGYVRAQSIAAGLIVPVGRVSLFLDGSGGITSGSPGWAASVGIGTTYAGLASVAVAAKSPLQRLRSTFGAGRTFEMTKPRSKIRAALAGRR